MKRTKARIATFLFTRALSRACPSLIPRSGADGAVVNCYSIYIDKNSAPYLLVRSLANDVLSCDEWTGSSFNKPIEIPLQAIQWRDVSITHFYGYNEIQFRGLAKFGFSYLTRLPYLKTLLTRLIETTDQYFFNKKKLVAKQRMDLLRFLVQRQLEGSPISSPISLMTNLYSLRWLQHPDRESHQNQLRFYLDSLVDTGELKKTGAKYDLTGEALKAIEVYEEQERKHTENVKIQRRMFWLTLTIVLFTAAEIELVKLPTILDLSSWAR